MANEINRSDSSGVLAEFAASVSEPHSVAANRPTPLNDPDIAWFVECGAVDVFAAEYVDGQIQSAFKHVFRLEPGRVAFGVEERQAGDSLRLVAKGLAGTQLRRLPFPALLKAMAATEGAGDLARALVVQVDAWIEDFAAVVARDIVPRPSPKLRLMPGEPVEASGLLSAGRGVVWIAGEKLDAAFLEMEEAQADGPGLMPVTRETWITLRRTAGVACLSSKDLNMQTLLLRALPEFHRLALGAEALNRRMMLADEANLQVARTVHRRRDEDAARKNLLTLSGVRRGKPAADDDALMNALNVIGRHEGITIRTPPVDGGREPSLKEIVQASGVRARRVRLSAEDRWWLGDSGAMLAFSRDDGRPLVLLPDAGGRYRLLDATSGRSRRATAETTGELLDHAWFLYRTLPADGAVGMKALLDVAGGNMAADLIRLAVAGLCAGLLALAPAVAVSLLIGTVIPAGDPASLVQFTAVLVALAFMAALSHMFRGMALMRLEGRVAARLSAAIWDRLLHLQLNFFRRFTAGELATRAMAIQILRDRISGIAADAFLSILFLAPTFGLLFFYSTALGWLTLGFGLVTLSVTTLLGALHIDPQRRYFETSRQLFGDLFQFLSGIAKLRATGAEGSAFAAWARRYREHKKAEIRLSFLSEHLAAFSAAVPALAAAALFAVAVRQGDGQLTTADFLAVYAASMVFYVSLGMLGNSVQAIASIVPGREQIRPILTGAIDPVPRRGTRVALSGEILLDRVSFGYSQNGPTILHDVSIHAKPGEFVAIVGESGSGKSTLFRLALGLENPWSGAVYYDGQDLTNLDRDSVRRQVGVVTQEGSLQSGNVLNSIIGVMEDLTIDDAWRAARQAAVDGDISAMPMGMYTAVGENAATFSGGQNQRIRIAAALVRNPRIIFLDEPTSWLDTKSQSDTMKGIEQSTSTRLVIAHRLSTIRKANRIYVLQDGRVAQTGGFDELIETDGPFRDLALRQMD